MSEQQVANRPAFVFDPPAGGDIILRTADDAVFCVHSVILGLVSSVFADMFSIGRSSGEEIRLDDDSESIALMLAFVYPSSITPIIDKIDLLEKCLIISQKYNVQKITQTLDRDLSRSEPQTRFIRSGDHPLQIFRLSMTYGLPECKLIAAKAVMPRHIDFFKPEEIVKAAQEHPASAHVVGLISAQILRAKIVADVIFGYEAEDFLPKTYVKVRDGQKSEFIDDSGGGMMMCDRCIPRLDIWDMKRPVSYIPSWLYGWSRYAYEELRAKPLDQATDIFKPQCLISFPPENMDVCEDCVKTAAEARTWDDGQPGEVFRDWASGVRNLLEKRLGVLDCLYSL